MHNLFFGHDLYIFLSETFLILSLILLLVYGVVYSTSYECGYPVLNRNVGALAVQVLGLSLLIHLISPPGSNLSCNNLLVLDDLSIFLKTITLLGSLCCVLLSMNYVKQEKLNNFEYFVLLLLGVVAIIFVSSAHDLLAMYLSIEFQSLVFYILATIRRSSEFSTEAGLKYFILGAFSSGLLLFGITMLYGFTGLTNFEDLSRFFINFDLVIVPPTSSAVLIGMAFIAASFFFKISAAPFHIWSPDVYEGAPTSVTAFFSIMPKVALLGLFSRLFTRGFHDIFFSWQGIFIFCALSSLAIGSFGAFAQVRLKRFLAYSSISHVGYLLTAFASSNTDGIVSLLVYIVVYIVMILGAFSVTLGLRQYHTPSNNSQVRYLQELAIISKTNPTFALAITIILFSMAGIPPLGGFFGKLFVFLSAIESSLYGLTIIGVLFSCVACFYYIRVVKMMYFDQLPTWPVYIPIGRLKSLVLGSSMLFLLGFAMDPELLILPSVVAENILNS